MPAVLACLLGAALASGGLVLACGGDDEETKTTAAGQDPELVFRGLQDELVATCGGANGSCHVQGTQAPRWLADPDPYESAKRYRGILPVTREVGDSILLTQVDHSGPALKRTPKLYEKVAAWIQAEVPPPALPSSGAFSVLDGYNVVELNAVGSGLTGARITFVGTQANGVLTLSALKLTAPRDADVKIDSPFFVILPRNGKVDADPEGNGFKGELTVPAGRTVDMYTGKMILLRWDSTGQLKIVFKAISSTPGQGAATGCTALELFKSSALPAMQSTVDVRPDDRDAGDAPIGKGSCVGCHAKAPGPDEAPGAAVQAMDLRGFDSDPAAACAQARFWINFTDRSQSTLLSNPTGANPDHPMAPIPATDPIITGLRTWIDAEQP